METSSIIPLLAAIVGGTVTVVTASITSRTQVAIASMSASRKDGRRSAEHKGERDADLGLQAQTASLSKQRNVTLAALGCGVVLLIWGIYSLVEIRSLNRLIKSKEDQYALLRLSFEKVTGITFNPIDVRAEYKVDGDTRDYSLWIEADDAVLDRIDHVKYVFDDKSWSADSVMTGELRKSKNEKAFECGSGTNEDGEEKEPGLYSYNSLTYITVLVMYKGYKDRNGEIQPIKFRWRSQEVEVE